MYVSMRVVVVEPEWQVGRRVEKYKHSMSKCGTLGGLWERACDVMISQCLHSGVLACAYRRSVSHGPRTRLTTH